tara:strand:- start:659 stop:2245 length:1587 start_codon:yes stop_codon:yes gene_type:complete
MSVTSDVLGITDRVVQTSVGLLEGEYSDSSDEVRVFRGVPYAISPIGENRWRPSKSVVPWDGVRQATEFSAPCWQRPREYSSLYTRGDLAPSEDCLYLNIWTSANEPTAALPVMLWFHGGGHNSGAGNPKIFDGTSLSKNGVIVVTINYRLGPFGFLAHPAFTAESAHDSSGNYGLLDQITALEWVHNNIAAFGGDPSNVTIFGQSAGSWSVCYLMASPLARGLFHKAIGQSGGCFKGERPYLDKTADTIGASQSAHEIGLSVAHELGVTGTGIEAARSLRAVKAEDILAVALGPGAIIDGWVLPKTPREIFIDGDHNDVPVIVGAMANERASLYEGPEPTREEFQASVKREYEKQSAAMLEAYAAELRTSPLVAEMQLQGDRTFVWEMRTWATTVENAGNDVYLYFFSHVPPTFRLYVHDDPDVTLPRGRRGYGAYHSGDLAYVFGNVGLVGLDWSDWDYELSNVISRYWANFARTGNPNEDGLPSWPRYERDIDQWLEFGDQIQATEDVRQEKLDLFDNYFSFPKF